MEMLQSSCVLVSECVWCVYVVCVCGVCVFVCVSVFSLLKLRYTEPQPFGSPCVSACQIQCILGINPQVCEVQMQWTLTNTHTYTHTHTHTRIHSHTHTHAHTHI